MIRLLLEKDPKVRMERSMGQFIDSVVHDESVYATISYDTLRGHSFFRDWHALINQPQQAFYRQLLLQQQQKEERIQPMSQLSMDCSEDALSSVQGVIDVFTQHHSYLPVHNDNPHSCNSGSLDYSSVPSLHDLCLRAVAEAAVSVSFATAHNGGLRPKLPWMQAFQLHKKLSALDRERVMHLLTRKEMLHVPGVHRLFFASLPDSRCHRAVAATKEVVGLTHALQGHCMADFQFVEIASPGLGKSLTTGTAGTAVESEEETRLRAVVASVNKIRPKFLSVVGPFTAATATDNDSDNTTNNNNTYDFVSLTDRFRKVLARVSDTITVVLVPSVCEVGRQPSAQSLARYRRLFGADYYGFWFQGMRGVVINSALLINGSAAPEEAVQQQLWLEEEIEQAKLCATTMVLFSYHPWFYSHIDEEDLPESDLVVR
jgi:hypothetical protein